MVHLEAAPDADNLQQFATVELRRYLRELFGVEATLGPRRRDAPGARIVLGLASAPHVQEAVGSAPRLSDQGYLVRRVDDDTMLLVGGSSAAVAWAVYDLIEQYGVRYLLHGDVFPQDAGAFHLPRVDAVREPLLQLRSWRQYNDLPTGPALWTLSQQEAFIRQIFKLRYNGIYLCLWPQHPFVDFEVKGIRRQTATLLFGQKIPIDDDNIGRQHLVDAPFLEHPDLVAARTYEERLAAGRHLIQEILRQAQFFQMHTAVHLQPLEFPSEFAPLLREPTEGIQLGGLTTSERGDLTHPDHVALIEAKLEAYLDQWECVKEFHLVLPEHPHADRQFQQCWQELDARYQLEKDTPLASLLEVAQRNYLIPGGLERATREFRSSISMLQFLDHFFAGNDFLQRAAAKGIDVHLNLGGNSEALFPVLERVLWPGGGISTSLGYTASRAVRAMQAMGKLDTARIPASLVVTLQDDNVGSMPQMATHSIDLLLDNAKRLGWRGFLTRHWPVGDLDPTAAYMARASWDATVTPEVALTDHLSHVYGPDAVSDLRQVMQLLEDATVILDLDFLSLFFPVLGIMCRTMESDAPMPEGLFHVRAMYEQARRIVERVDDRVSTEAGSAELAYWRSRLEFAVQALVEKDHLHEAGQHLHQARRAEADDSRDQHLAAARQLYELAVQAGEAAIRATAAQVRDDSDRSTLAAYYHFFVRQVREMADRLLGGDEGVFVQDEPM